MLLGRTLVNSDIDFPTIETCADHILRNSKDIKAFLLPGPVTGPTPHPSPGGALLAFKSPPPDRLPTVNKVDVMEARRGLQPIGGKPPPGQVTHAPYRREPYVRAQLDDGTTVDAKAAAWTRTHVLLHWMDDGGKAWNVWVVAVRVTRIRAEESRWRDVYDLEW